MEETAVGSGASAALRLMLRPRGEYRRRVEDGRSGRWPRALATPVLVAMIFGIAMSVAATGRISVPLFLAETLYWSFVPLLQLATASALIASAPERRVDFPRALELAFDGHGPWSLWIVCAALAQLAAAGQAAVYATALIPFAWTTWILLAFADHVLAVPGRRAAVRVAAHQAATVLLILAYVHLAVGLTIRIMGAWDRWR